MFNEIFNIGFGFGFSSLWLKPKTESYLKQAHPYFATWWATSIYLVRLGHEPRTSHIPTPTPFHLSSSKK